MKIELLGGLTTVMSNPGSKHSYFGWPTVARLQNGKIAAVASGYRLDHVCPFGKMVIAYSEDECESFTIPAPVIDTVLDDRDGGIMTFGDGGVIVTSFNNTVAFQRNYAERYTHNKYALAYLDTVTEEEEKAVHGATFRISHDCGVTFGPLMKSPVTSPHGPIECSDGRIVWVGRIFDSNALAEDAPAIRAYELSPCGTMTELGAIPNVEGYFFCEPHMVEASDGTLITHIRVQDGGGIVGKRAFTLFQSESKDGGKTWTVPHQILSDFGGAPAHLLRTKSGRLLSVYGYRTAPYGIRLAVSDDCGKSWVCDLEICAEGTNHDIGYPATVELQDGSFFTLFYMHKTSEDYSAVILGQKWRFA